MNKHISVLLFIVYFLSIFNGFSQTFNKQNLIKIAENQEAIKSKNKDEIDSYLSRIKRKGRFIDLGDGRIAYLNSVKDGVPYYVSTYNLQSRKTTGVDSIQSESGLGLNLKGQGITVGVWDGGQVFKDHVELIGRVTNKNGAEFSNHATHVTGTIAAKGINEQAMGMAPEAEVIAYYAFVDDLGPMAMEAANGLILSNHSYGLVLGWHYDQSSDKWVWYGGSGNVDERFGYYSDVSKTIDDITYNAPYYTIVWAAGNDRNDTGDGTKQADGPYNIIGPSASSKNVITVGAITGFDEYQGKSSIVMSDFSSWGPTDDGRIKPDIVADGVNVLSTSSAGAESYATLNGTSMAAPSVTGSLAVLQQYYRQIEDTFMTSATLKSLVIHTAREAGSNPGPDVKFGWGVLNVLDAYKVIEGKNASDTLIINEVLTDGNTYETELFSDGITPITATLVWTDVPGTPGIPGTDALMLKNDLDLRIIDDEGNTSFPWVLDTNNPNKAVKGDNFRDNVEKIELTNPQPRRYTLRVTHKNSLVNSEQAFALIITGGAINSNKNNEFYWITDTGNFSEYSNWSMNSGGAPLGVDTPLDNGTLVFDNNSGLTQSGVITLSGNLAIDNFVWLNDNASVLDLGGDTLTINKNIKIDGANLIVRNGAIRYISSTNTDITLNLNGSESFTFIADTDSDLNINGDINVSSLVVLSGRLFLNNSNVMAKEIGVSPQASATFTNNVFDLSGKLNLESEITSNGNKWNLDGVDVMSGLATQLVLNDTFKIVAASSFFGEIGVEKMIIQGTAVNFANNAKVDSLFLEEGSSIILGEQDTLSVERYLEILSSGLNTTSISGNSSTMKSVLAIDYRSKLCFDNLMLENLVFYSDAVFNVGLSSTLTNTLNFESKDCDQILYADFNVQNNCANSVIQVNDLSIGPIDNYNWLVENGQQFDIGEKGNTEIYFDSEGTYNVTLTVGNQAGENSYSKDFDIASNSMDIVRVVENSSGLVSDKSGESYQWYRDGTKLIGETSRSIAPDVQGLYQVAYVRSDSSCINRISEPFEYIVAGIKDRIGLLHGVKIFPNPVKRTLNISGINEAYDLFVIDTKGRIVLSDRVSSDRHFIDMGPIQPGLYVVKLVGPQTIFESKVLKINN